MRRRGTSTNPADTHMIDGDNLVHISNTALIALRNAGERLSLKPSRIAAPHAGSYLTRFKGRGMEFDETRLYQAGDDARNLDWRVTARTGKLHTKLFREERERAVLTWVDMRPTMFFATRGAFKSVIAAQAAALVAWNANKRGDRLGGLVFTANSHHELRPKPGKTAVLHLLQQLSQASNWQNAHNQQTPEADNALARLRRVTRPGSLLFLISDFRKLGPLAASHLAQLSRHNDIVLFHIHDPLEQALPKHGSYRITWGPRSHTINGGTALAQKQHQHQFQQHCEYLQQFCRYPGIHYIRCATNEDVQQKLHDGLELKHR